MCFSKPDIPKPKPVPRTPTPDDDAVRAREEAERERLRAQAGRASTLVSDLSASDVGGGKRVLLGV